MSPRITISGYYGFDNAGDEALLSALVSDLHREVEGAELTVLSRDPGETRRTHGVGAVDRFHLPSVLRVLRNTDLFISGGGTLLQDKTSLRSLIYYASLALVASSLGARLMLYASGLGPLDSRLGRELARRVILRADAVTLRDNLSRQKLDELFRSGLPDRVRGRIRVTADPAFGLSAVSPQRTGEILSQEGLLQRQEDLLIVSIRPWEGQDSLVRAVTGALEQLAETAGVFPVFLPMHYPEDHRLAQVLARGMKTPSHVITRAYSPQEVIGLMGCAQGVVGMRLHSLIMAVTSGVPCLGLIYDPKVSGFLADMGLPATGPIPEITASNLLSRVTSFLDSLETYRQRIREQRGVLRRRARENARIARDLLT